MELYELEPSSGKSWVLGIPCDREGKKIDVWALSDGRRVRHATELSASIEAPGTAVDITLSAFGYAVISERCANMFLQYCGETIQLISVDIASHGRCWILNPLALIDCLDPSCVSSYFPRSYWDKPKAGKPCMVHNLSVFGDKVGDSHCFRIKDWAIPIFVSGAILKDIRDSRMTGVVGGRVKVV